MSQNYTPTEWVDNRTVGTASVMNNMEKGIKNAHNRIDEVDSQIEENKKKIEKRINIYEYESLVVNEDWSVAINTAIQENPNSEIFIPGGDFKCKSTINFSGLCKIVGVKNQTNLLLTTENTTLINMNRTSSNQDHAIFENINLKGLGNDKNQKGIDFNAWNSKIKCCTISHFNIGISAKGVLLDIDNCYIHNNTKGIEIEQFEDSVPSTMISTKNSLIHYNDIGVFASDYGDPNNKRPCIGMYFDNDAFEWNNYAFKLTGEMHTSFKNCWFEQNHNRPETYAINLILENNRYEYSGGKDQTINFLSSETGAFGVYGGYNESYGGYYKTKILELEEYNSSDLTCTSSKQLKIKDKNLVVDEDKVVIAPGYQRHYSVSLSKKGIAYSDFPDGTISFVNNGIGDYSINFINGKNLGTPVITTTFVNDDGGTELIGITRLFFKDLATYLDWNAVDCINLKSYSSDGKTPCDSKVMISIWCDAIYPIS